MSLPSTLIICTGCSFQDRELYRPVQLLYRLDAATYAKGEWERFCWCHPCNRLVYRERLDISRNEAQWERMRKLAALFKANDARMLKRRQKVALERGTPMPQPSRFPEDQPDHDNVAALQRLLLLFKTRVSPPRCLECGSTEVEKLQFDEQDGLAQGFRHTCGGQLRRVPLEDDPQPIRYAFNLTRLVLDIEGNKLEEGLGDW